MTLRMPWLFFAVSALGLPLFLWAFQAQNRLAALPDGFPAPSLSFPVRIEGTPAASPEEVRFLAERFAPGTSVEILTADGQLARMVLRHAFGTLTLVVTCASGLLFWAVSAFVFAPRTGARPVRGFFWCTFLYGLAVMIGGVHAPGAPAWPAIAGAIAQFACLAALPPLFVHLTLDFPRRDPLLDRRPWIIRVLVALAAALVAAQSGAYLWYHRTPGPRAFEAFSAAGAAADALLVAQVLAGFFILARSMGRLELTRERAQVKWLLWGFAIGVTPYVFLRTFVQLLGGRAPLDPVFDRVLELAIPFAFVAAVVLYRFLDIDIIIRRSVIYAGVALLMTSMIVALGLLLGRGILGARGGRWPLLVPLAVGVGAGMLFVPLRRAVGWWVDRTFFHLTLGYGRALESLRTRLESISNPEELAVVVDRFLEEVLRPRAHSARWSDAEEPAAERTWGGAFLSRTVAAPNTTSLPEIESRSFPAAWIRQGFVLAEPVRAGRDPAGFILLGERRTERRYIDRDIRLVRSVADEAGRALERIRLVRRAASEGMARQRSEELNRMKGEFLSRVAHDLRTPLASIIWSARNMLDGVKGTLSEGQAEYLRSVRASAEHLNRLVANLLEISRIEQGRGALDLAPVLLRPVLEQAIVTLRPIASEKGIEVRLDAPDGLGPVMGNEDCLLEVAINLLDNATRYSPPSGEIAVTVRAAPAGYQTLEVRDHGPGLADADAERLFERFSQGPRSPHTGTLGFGLGLCIVKSHVEMMRGQVTAANHPMGGAVFSCSIPEPDPERIPR